MASTDHNEAIVAPGIQVRYIKLGEGGSWEKECLDRGIVRFGFGSASPQRFPLCRAKEWDQLKQSFITEGKSKGTATRFTNETRIFFEDNGSTLWITFNGADLYWGILTGSPPEPHPDGHGVYRTVKDGWRRTDVNGEPLTKDRLSGALTKVAAYQGTTCGMDTDVADYVRRRINGQKTPQVERAVAAIKEMKASALDLMKLLGWRDFETLVDLVFTSSGWRRLGIVGGPEKTRDIDLMLPSTNQKAFVQVKSETTSAELAEYVAKLDEHDGYDLMFYVFHSGDGKTEDERVIVIGPEKLSEMVIDAGLVNWLVRKVS
jgi:hypothetical protein